MLSKILRGLLILVVGFLGIGLLLPGNTHIERAIDIAAPAPAVFDHINELKNWAKWSPFVAYDPNMKVIYSEPSSAGIGASYAWIGNDHVGEGKMTITETKPTEKVRFKMAFKGGDPANADFIIAAKDSTTTKVVWTFDQDTGMNPLSRWFGIAMNSFLGPDYEQGLANLKAVCEKK
jgi:hypothetical protein